MQIKMTPRTNNDDDDSNNKNNNSSSSSKRKPKQGTESPVTAKTSPAPPPPPPALPLTSLLQTLPKKASSEHRQLQEPQRLQQYHGQDDMHEDRMIEANLSPYETIIYRRIRKLKKRLARIDTRKTKLESNPSAMDNIDPSQLDAVGKKPEVVALINELEDLMKPLKEQRAVDEKAKKQELEEHRRELEKERERVLQLCEEFATACHIQVLRLLFSFNQLETAAEVAGEPLSSSLKILDEFCNCLFQVAATAELQDNKSARKRIHTMITKLAEASPNVVYEDRPVTYKDVCDELDRAIQAPKGQKVEALGRTHLAAKSDKCPRPPSPHIVAQPLPAGNRDETKSERSGADQLLAQKQKLAAATPPKKTEDKSSTVAEVDACSCDELDALIESMKAPVQVSSPASILVEAVDSEKESAPKPVSALSEPLPASIPMAQTVPPLQSLHKLPAHMGPTTPVVPLMQSHPIMATPHGMAFFPSNQALRGDLRMPAQAGYGALPPNVVCNPGPFTSADHRFVHSPRPVEEAERRPQGDFVPESQPHRSGSKSSRHLTHVDESQRHPAPSAPPVHHARGSSGNWRKNCEDRPMEPRQEHISMPQQHHQLQQQQPSILGPYLFCLPPVLPRPSPSPSHSSHVPVMQFRQIGKEQEQEYERERTRLAREQKHSQDQAQSEEDGSEEIASPHRPAPTQGHRTSRKRSDPRHAKEPDNSGNGGSGHSTPRHQQRHQDQDHSKKGVSPRNISPYARTPPLPAQVLNQAQVESQPQPQQPYPHPQLHHAQHQHQHLIRAQQANQHQHPHLQHQHQHQQHQQQHPQQGQDIMARLHVQPYIHQQYYQYPHYYYPGYQVGYDGLLTHEYVPSEGATSADVGSGAGSESEGGGGVRASGIQYQPRALEPIYEQDEYAHYGGMAMATRGYDEEAMKTRTAAQSNSD